jgi:Hint domain-containing protein/von Willebrand factor type A domain-containing protein
MADITGPIDEQSVTGVPINPESNNPISVDQTSILSTTDNGGIGRDGFELGVNLTGSNVAEQVNIAIVIDTSGSTGASSGTDFDGDGNNETILEAELFAAAELFDAYVDAGYDPSEISISLTTYSGNSDPVDDQWGTFSIGERDDFVSALDDIRAEGSNGATNFEAGLNSVDTAWTNAGVDPADTNIVIFLSDGEPWPDPAAQDIEGARDDLVDDWGATISGIGLGINSSLDDLNRLDTTSDGANQVLSGQELLDIVVAPLTEADFLRFEITIEGFDDAGNPQTQTITLPEGDPAVITTQLGWSIDCLPIDPIFSPGQNVTVTVNGIFAEDPGNPGSGEQVVTTQHEVTIVVCFTPGTRIVTPKGEIAVETLEVGDRVVTRDHGIQQIRWIGSTKVTRGRIATNASLRPILIRKGALGTDLPERDMRVSRQHRLLVRDWRAEVLFGEDDGVLVPAFALCNDKTITEERPTEDVEYIHIAFENHEIIYADGLEAESFHPADRTVAGLSEAQREELLTLFPQLAQDSEFAYSIARDGVRGREARLFRD